VGRVNEFPYQTRAASCRESLLLSPRSIDATYSRAARRLANNKTVLCTSLTHGRSFHTDAYRSGTTERKERREKKKRERDGGGGSRRRESYICVSLAAQRAFAFLIGIGKGKGKQENKISVYSRRASPAKCSAVSFSFRWNIHFSRQINPREQCTFADGIADAKVAICLGEFSQSPRRPPP